MIDYYSHPFLEKSINILFMPSVFYNTYPRTINFPSVFSVFVFLLIFVCFVFYSKYNRIMCKRSVKTLISCHVLGHLIRVCTVRKMVFVCELMDEIDRHKL